MKEQSIITIPSKILSEVAQKVTSFDKSLENQVDLMRKTLATENGAGLAANQIGLKNSVIVIELKEKEKNSPAGESIPFGAYINPEIVESSLEKDSLDEGCLSIPQIELPVERAVKVKVRAWNPEGKKIKFAAKGTFARILQHEIDHLNGIVFTDRVRQKYLLDYPESKSLKILFFGSGSFGAIILEGLILLGLKIDIVTEKGKSAGRGGQIHLTPVAEMAKRFKKKYVEIDNLSSELLVSQGNLRRPKSMVSERSEEFLAEHVGTDLPLGKSSAGTLEELRASIIKTDLLICADFGQKIPKNILKAAKITAINLHPSLLPKYRGATPIQTAILEGEKETGVTIIKMSPKIDKGGILAQIKTEINADDNSLTLENKLTTLALKLFFEVLPLATCSKLKEISQNEKEATITRKFTKLDGEIDWAEPAEKIERKIRAFTPWPGSYTFIDNQRLIIHKAHLEKEKLVLDRVQKEGGKQIKWADFLRGYRGEKPEWFDKVK